MDDEITFGEYLQELKEKLADAGKANRHFLLLTCIDLRYPSFIHGTLDEFDVDPKTGFGYFEERYDHLALAGAGLAGVIDFPPHKKPEWAETVVQHIALSIMLHDIGAVVILDHRDCGAYRAFGLLPSRPVQKDHETDDEFRERLDEYYSKEAYQHIRQINRLIGVIEDTFPNVGLILDGFLLPERAERPEKANRKEYLKALSDVKMLRAK